MVALARRRLVAQGVKYGLHGFVAACLLNAWFIIA
jgi:hypothetical protein